MEGFERKRVAKSAVTHRSLASTNEPRVSLVKVEKISRSVRFRLFPRAHSGAAGGLGLTTVHCEGKRKGGRRRGGGGEDR